MKVILSSSAPAPAGHYSQAIEHNGLVYVSGQLPIDPERVEKHVGNIEEQTEQVLRNLEAILKVGLLGPIMLTRMALPNLLRFRGQLINIIPANKSGHIASAVNALIEGGLREMNTALFDQARDAGLRVTNLILRQNTVTDDATFADKHLQTRIDPDHVARTVEQLLNPNEPNVPNEITL